MLNTIGAIRPLPINGRTVNAATMATSKAVCRRAQEARAERLGRWHHVVPLTWKFEVRNSKSEANSKFGSSKIRKGRSLFPSVIRA
jgi:hypothetical protein